MLMPVIQASKDKVVVRFYTVGESEKAALVNGFYDKHSDAVFEQQVNGGKVFTIVRDFDLDKMEDITPTK
jgi:hypothetical protein